MENSDYSKEDAPEGARGRDWALFIAVGLLAAAMAGLVIGGVIALAGDTTPAVEVPIVLITALLFILGMATVAISGARGHPEA